MFLDRRATSAVVDAIQRVREKKVVFVLHGLDSESSMADSATLWLSSGAMLSTAPCQECAASPPPAETVSEDTLLAVESLHYSYPHATEPTLVNVSVSVQRGEAVCITGANGAGKTTLLLLLAGLLRPNRGRVYLHGSVAKRRHLRRNVRVAFQQPDAQIFLRTAEEELTFGPRCSGVARDVALLNMRSTASMLPFRLDVDPMSLSFGQRKLLTIACALAAKPPLVALDEPLAGLDSHARRCVREMLGTFLRSGGAAVVTSSHGDRELSLCHRGIRLQSSRDNGE
jgi:energy-coupling factor transporter ATP-binding protein EcfA2